MSDTNKPNRHEQPERSTPGRPSDTSRQQKHPGQNVQSGGEPLDRRSGQDKKAERGPIPPGPK
jgi:hypothetical protein